MGCKSSAFRHFHILRLPRGVLPASPPCRPVRQDVRLSTGRPGGSSRRGGHFLSLITSTRTPPDQTGSTTTGPITKSFSSGSPTAEARRRERRQCGCKSRPEHHFPSLSGPQALQRSSRLLTGRARGGTVAVHFFRQGGRAFRRPVPEAGPSRFGTRRQDAGPPLVCVKKSRHPAPEFPGEPRPALPASPVFFCYD